jgi:hypothetical protein
MRTRYPIALSRRQLLSTVGCGALFAALEVSVRAQQQPVLAGFAPGFPWDEVVAVARDFVTHESPDEIWPFERATQNDQAKSERQVFLHYFTPFQGQ